MAKTITEIMAELREKNYSIGVREKRYSADIIDDIAYCSCCGTRLIDGAIVTKELHTEDSINLSDGHRVYCKKCKKYMHYNLNITLRENNNYPKSNPKRCRVVKSNEDKQND